MDGIPVTTPARTALDLGCWYPTEAAVAAIDALVRAADIKVADVELLARATRADAGIRACADASLDLVEPVRSRRKRRGSG